MTAFSSLRESSSSGDDDQQHTGTSRGSQFGVGLLQSRPALALPFGVLVGSLCTLVLLSMTRGNVGLPWRGAYQPGLVATAAVAAVKALAQDCVLPTPAVRPLEFRSCARCRLSCFIAHHASAGATH